MFINVILCQYLHRILIMSESSKRSHCPSTGATPGKKPPKRPIQENVKKTSRKSLFQTGTVIKKKVESVIFV